MPQLTGHQAVSFWREGFTLEWTYWDQILLSEWVKELSQKCDHDHRAKGREYFVGMLWLETMERSKVDVQCGDWTEGSTVVHSPVGIRTVVAAMCVCVCVCDYIILGCSELHGDLPSTYRSAERWCKCSSREWCGGTHRWTKLTSIHWRVVQWEPNHTRDSYHYHWYHWFKTSRKCRCWWTKSNWKPISS